MLASHLEFHVFAEQTAHIHHNIGKKTRPAWKPYVSQFQLPLLYVTGVGGHHHQMCVPGVGCPRGVGMGVSGGGWVPYMIHMIYLPEPYGQND